MGNKRKEVATPFLFVIHWVTTGPLDISGKTFDYSSISHCPCPWTEARTEDKSTLLSHGVFLTQ